ncbi:dihydropteroate synthase [Candidatus Acidulodesulfobacterium sp. H_13]|uniref:dihydropteroate synthase n=1 Tax=Candidatus Acidulodesulfobacterium sp. H_13 TaxID=3395470 RepID=UPI003AF9961C
MQAYLIDIFDSRAALKALYGVGVSNIGKIIMGEKLKYAVIKLKNISPTTLNILKQEALSIGAELANHRDVITGKIDGSDSILFGTPVQLRIVIKKIKSQGFGLKELSVELENILKVCDGSHEKVNNRTMRTAKGDISFNGKTYIMGVLNITPDSFSDGGKYLSYDSAVKRGIEIEKDGADIIDIGGESTRPSASEIDEQIEIDRVCPVIENLSKTLDIPISIDTRKPAVAKEAIKAGAHMINDVSGLSYNAEAMAKIVISADVPYIMMHSREKSPENMQKDLVPYDDMFYEVLSYFENKIDYLKAGGYDADNNVIIDPGFGFAKSMNDNYDLLSGIISFKSLGLPVMAGVSRKSFINRITGKNRDNILSGNIAIFSYLKLKGIDIVRVHDVRQTASAFASLNKIM